ncbi:MAG: hypothetical protein COX92_01135 [Candidatus Nealsonbacteria bacterium CG_4_10_14_0_2_um_filter_40_15]|uniref:Uncharacterized protein n=1 Tax=Candidatus Nealsonbacteria bacterium CG_4_10_14_0_2_um_filter_40_15 TaxID=1974682 RepID=A0A2M7UUH1_9BACT|nr:MAG: hypothetical protein COX92_01135 [Candidatus Nealsonbacteria bacterium CG_4_10_14_0_2_um_filter_40_15]
MRNVLPIRLAYHRKWFLTPFSKDGSPDTPEEIRNKLEGLNGDERIDKSAIRGLEELIRGIGKGTGLTFFGGGGLLRICLTKS